MDFLGHGSADVRGGRGVDVNKKSDRGPSKKRASNVFNAGNEGVSGRNPRRGVGRDGERVGGLLCRGERVPCFPLFNHFRLCLHERDFVLPVHEVGQEVHPGSEDTTRDAVDEEVEEVHGLSDAPLTHKKASDTFLNCFSVRNRAKDEFVKGNVSKVTNSSQRSECNPVWYVST